MQATLNTVVAAWDNANNFTDASNVGTSEGFTDGLALDDNANATNFNRWVFVRFNGTVTISTGALISAFLSAKNNSGWSKSSHPKPSLYLVMKSKPSMSCLTSQMTA